MDRIDTLLAETRWLERMARSLCADPHTAEDLAQEAQLAALRTPASSPGAPWFLGTLRKLAARTFRTQARRHQREQARALSDSAPPTVDVVARTEVHSNLLAHVRALPETYRVPLLLRFYDDLPPRAIAARLGIPVATVHTRLQRAVEHLRQRLDRDHPKGRAGWLAALGWPSAPSHATGLRTALWAGAMVLGLTMGVFALFDGVGHPEPPSTRAAVLSATPSQADDPRIADRAPHANRETARAATPWRGRVLGWDGHGVANARVDLAPHLGLVWDPDGEHVILQAGTTTTLPNPSDRDGAFAASLPSTPVEIRADSPGQLTALVGIWRPDDLHQPRVVMAPSCELAAQILDEDGVPIAAAWVEIALSSAGDGDQRGLHPLDWRATSDAQGHFAFTAVPDVDEAILHITAAGFVAQAIPLRRARGPFVLTRWPAATDGLVVDANGRPVPRAVVVTGDVVAVSDDAGRFRTPRGNGSVALAAAGWQPIVTGPLPALATMTLTAPACNLVGTLHTATGEPLAGWEISLADPTVAGTTTSIVVLEAVAAGRGRSVLHATTRADGSFALPGLADRPYRLRCVDPRTAASFVSEPVSPNATAIVRAPADLCWPMRTLRLCRSDRSPLAGALVTVQAPGYVTPLADSTARDVWYAHGSTATTDARGVFTLTGVPRRDATLRIDHPDTGLSYIDVANLAFDLVILPRCGALFVRMAAPCNSLELLDAVGSPVTSTQYAGVSLRRATLWSLRDRSTLQLEVPETAVQLRLHGNDGATRTIPVTIRPGTTTTLDL